MKFKNLIFVLFFVTNACNLNMNTSGGHAAGMIDDVLFITEHEDWMTELGDTIRYFFQKPYAVLPQYEPTFTINYIKPEHFTDLLQNARNVIIVGPVEKDRTTKLAFDIFGKDNIDFKKNIAVKKNKYAQGQQITYIYGKNNEVISKYLNYRQDEIIETVAANEKPKMYANLFYGGVENDLIAKLKDKFGIAFKVPKGFRVALEKDDFLWLRYDDPKFTYNVFFSESTGQKQKNFGIEERNRLGKTYVKGTSKGSYMTTENEMEYIQYQEKINNSETIVSKGLWELTKDFLGGPFVNYKFTNSKTGNTLVIDGFVKSPGSKKRQKMRQLSYMIEQTKFVD